MPTYEYICRACGHEFEEFHSITAAPIKKCPSCGKLKVDRKIGIGAGVLFKGGGFYETDYRSEHYTKAAEAEKKAAEPKADAAKGEGKPAGDAKPASGEAPKAAGKTAGTTPAKDAPSPPKPAAPAEPSKATHPSRVGRGAGNIVQRPPQPKAKGSGRRQGPNR